MFTNKNNLKTKNYFMSLALTQAQRSLGNTGKNPSVGCVIVKNDCVVTSGHTSINGRPHAEQNAIQTSSHDLKDGEIYVTLEPCSHYGKTPPCVNKIIRNKIKKVYFSIYDPDLRSYKKSIKQFKKKKIAVNNGILKSKTNKFYKSYIRSKKKDLPYVTAKMAISKDFFTCNKKNRWVTNNYSRGRAHIIRSKNDCVLTSYKTVLKDNPRLTCRIKGLESRSPDRIIIDKKLQIPLTSKILRSYNNESITIFYYKSDKKKISYLKKINVNLIKVDLNKTGDFDLKNILIKIKKLGYSRILLESGVKLTSNFLQKKLIDEFYIFVSSYNLNKNGSSSFKNTMKKHFSKKKFYVPKVNLLGDKLISYRMK